MLVLHRVLVLFEVADPRTESYHVEESSSTEKLSTAPCG